MCIEEQRTIAKPVEELEEVTLDELRSERTTRIGTLASEQYVKPTQLSLR